MTDQPAAQAQQPEEMRRQQEQLVQGALLGPVPKIYMNGFAFAQTASDISVVTLLHNQPLAVLTMSYTTAKSLLSDLSQVLTKYEEAVEQPIKTFVELNVALSRINQ
jgi:hypothetical protein